MITCKEVAQHIGCEEYKELSLWGRVKVRLHLFLCPPCRRFASQVRFIGACVREHLAERREDRSLLRNLENRILHHASGEAGKAVPDAPEKPK